MLALLKQTTKSLEGLGISLTKALPTMDFILKRFEDRRKEYKNNTVIAPLFQNSQEKLRKYYKLTDETLVYIAVIVLNLSYKQDYVNDYQEKDQILKAEVYYNFFLLRFILTFIENNKVVLGI